MSRGRSLLLIAGVLAGCGGGGGSDERGAVATTTQVGDLVRNVAGDRIHVTTILGPNADPHEYEPRPSDARALTSAAVVFRSGGEVDEWLGDLLAGAGGDAPTVNLSNKVELRGDDPHWWQDPRNAVIAVGEIRDGLTKADPEGRETYEKNSLAYIRRLEQLDAGISRCFARVREESRKLVTSHDALGYFADRYDIEVLGSLIPSLSSHAQASAGEIEELVQAIRREHVRTIFPESSLNPKLERAVAREAGVKVGEPLYADTLGPEGSAGETYIGSMAANTERLVDGFTGGELSCRPGG